MDGSCRGWKCLRHTRQRAAGSWPIAIAGRRSASPGIVHRLDKETSGVILVAKNDAAHAKLGEAFRLRAIKKTYIALVQGVLGEIEAYRQPLGVQRGEVHSNLMRAPGGQLDLHQRRARRSWRALSSLACLARMAMASPCQDLRCVACGAVDWVAPDGQLDWPLFSPRTPCTSAIYVFLDGAQAKRFAEFGVRGIVLGNQKSRRKFPCRAVHDAWPKRIACLR